MRLKPEKWVKLVISDEQRRHLENFVYKGCHPTSLLPPPPSPSVLTNSLFYSSDLPQVLIISQNIGGQLQIHTDWPSPLRNKGVFFVKREDLPLPDKVKELLNHMTCGDIHPNSLEHFCALVEEVMVPILKNEANMSKFPQCISDGNYIHFTKTLKTFTLESNSCRTVRCFTFSVDFTLTVCKC